jgi:uncharacterized protein (DUF1778 family)
MKKTTKTADIHIRVTPEQKRTIQAKAEALGLKVSDYCRMLCLGYEVRIEKGDADS